ncbi:hypothetical protein [Clostridium sp.]|uniref:hypothetical protein n=1 Tax=Clostridium sp. TaxID=1506 RepID=UPI0039946B8A
MYVIKLFYSKADEMEDMILCSATQNNVNKMFYTCVDELQKYFAYKFEINGSEAVIKMHNLYLKIYVEAVSNKFKITDKVNDIILKVKN